ncbi:MAG: glycoside hydrolase family 28 protein [Bacteroidales bacterium]|nr:glycoside hydrolase family 28 protein [Bacteroidales bacterium]
MNLKKILFSLIAVLFSASALYAGDYASYYTGLPLNLPEPQAPAIPDTRVNIADFGAVGDGISMNTEAFAAAVKALEKLGGGHIDVPAGMWLTGPIVLKDRMDLHVGRNAIVLFSPDKTDFLLDGKVQPCIGASKRSDISITGDGILDGNGQYWRAVKRSKVSEVEWKDFRRMGGTVTPDEKLWYPFNLNQYPNIAGDYKNQEKMRTHMIRFTECERVLIKGVTVQNSPKFHLIPTRCRNVIVDGVTVRCPWNAQNGDGIDFSCCQDVLVVNCTVDVGDDGICLKAGDGEAAAKACPPIARVLICDNTVFHAHGGFVVGSEFSAGVEDVVVCRNVFSGTDTGLRFKSGPGRGGKTSRIYIYDIIASAIRESAVVFETSYADVPVGRSAKTANTAEWLPEFTDIHISRMTCREARTGIFARGTKEMIHDITLEDCVFSQCADKAMDVPDMSMIKMNRVRF